MSQISFLSFLLPRVVVIVGWFLHLIISFSIRNWNHCFFLFYC